MNDFSDVKGIGRSLKSVSQSIETQFLDAGQQLEQAIGATRRIVDRFEALARELKAEELTQATGTLDRITADLAALGSQTDSKQATLVQMQDRIRAVGSATGRLGTVVRTIGVLAINAKIEAAHITDANLDLSGFTSGIGRLMAMASTSLEGFGGELARLEQHVGEATANQANFEGHQATAIRDVPKRLSASIASMTEHTGRSAGLAVTVGARSEELERGIGRAVMSLQLGDITRQRIEHVEEALATVERLHGWTLGTALSSEEASEWATLGDDQRRSLLAAICELQSAQLAHTAQEFEEGAAQIARALDDVARDAQGVVQVGHDIQGGDGRDSFLDVLRRDVDRAHDVLEGYRTAQGDAAQVLGAVSRSVDDLIGHIDTLRSMEIDIRLMGLNTSLKCGRLGRQGLSLGVIAQELRGYANAAAEDTGNIMRDLGELTATGQTLVEGGHEVETVEQDARLLRQSVACFDVAGAKLGEAVGALEQDGRLAGRLLAETIQRIEAYRTVGQVLRQAADDLKHLSTLADCGVEERERAGDWIQRLMKGSYTMGSQRAVHSGFTGSADADLWDEPASVSEEAMLDDILF